MKSAEQLRAIARECLTNATCAPTDKSRTLLSQIAAAYERAARLREERRGWTVMQ
jgi:hypothetical protein